MILPSLSHREKTLAAIVCGVVIIFVTGLLVNILGDSIHQLQADIRAKTMQLQALRTLASQEALWKRRDAWLDSKRPTLRNQDNVGLELLNQIRDAALRNQVALDHPAIDSLDFRGEYVAVSVQLETRSSWSAVLEFLHDLQAPEQFVVIEGADLKIDEKDHTQMHGHLKIAKWYTPAAPTARSL